MTGELTPMHMLTFATTLSLFLAIWAQSSPVAFEKCDSEIMAESRWSVTANSSMNPDNTCVIAVPNDQVEDILRAEDGIYVHEVSDTFGGQWVEITFSGSPPPDMIKVTARYGDKMAQHTEITNCFADRVTVSGEEKNKHCEVNESDNGTMSIRFLLSERMNTLDRLTVLLSVQWVDSDSFDVNTRYHVYHYLVLLQREND